MCLSFLSRSGATFAGADLIPNFRNGYQQTTIVAISGKRVKHSYLLIICFQLLKRVIIYMKFEPISKYYGVKNIMQSEFEWLFADT